MKTPKWIKAFFRKREKYWKIKSCVDIPENIRDHTLYLIYNDGVYWQILMQCPCGCQTILHLNTLPEYKPNWGLTLNKKGRPSIHPSINRLEGCKSHFFIKNGQTRWV